MITNYLNMFKFHLKNQIMHTYILSMGINGCSQKENEFNMFKFLKKI